MNRKVERRPQGGFTLIELLVTLGIIAVLATIVVPSAQLVQQRQKEQELRLALRDIRQAVDAYKRASDEGRLEKKAGATGYPPSLEVLAEGVEDRRSPKREKLYFIRRIPRDPFHANPEIPAAQTWGLRAYASEADDPRPGDDVYDVYTLSPLKGLDGVALREW